MKIAVYGIALDEEAHADRFMASCAGADLVLIADTGSTDRTRERLAALGAEVVRIRVEPWRFDRARNTTLALLPDDIDVCVSLDLDQTLAPGWRAAVEGAWQGGVNRLYYPLVYRPAGESGEESFVDGRIHARFGFGWRYPCHEILAPEGEERPAMAPGLRIIHQPDDAKSRGGYIALLELAAREAPNDPHCAHFLGRELYQAGRHAEAAGELERRLALTVAGDQIERNASLRYLAHCREALGEADAAMALFALAAQERPDLRGAWVELAWAHLRRQAWTECLAAAERAIAFPDVPRAYGDDTAHGVVAEDIACLAAWSLGRPQSALEFARAGLLKAPASPRLRANLARIEAALAEGQEQGFGVSATPLGDEN
jgi:tetratricopeptide (TPR) repeat protein